MQIHSGCNCVTATSADTTALPGCKAAGDFKVGRYLSP